MTPLRPRPVAAAGIRFSRDLDLRPAMTMAPARPVPGPLATARAIAVLASVLAAAGTGGGCASGRAPSDRFVEQAQRLHDEALAATVHPDEDLNEYVQELGERLERAAEGVAPDKVRGPFFRSMQFHLVDVPIINAFTTGGSHVYVYRGLFDYCQTEEELAAAMAHAYAHALNLDIEGTGMNPPAESGAGARRPLRQVAWDFVVNRFDLQQEQAADELAFELYVRAGWDPSQFGRLFSRLSDPGEGVTPGVAPDRQPLATRGAMARGNTAGIAKRWKQLPVADRRTFASLREQAEKLRYVSAAAEQGNVEALQYLVAFPNCILSEDSERQRQAQELLRPPPPPAVEVEPN